MVDRYYALYHIVKDSIMPSESAMLPQSHSATSKCREEKVTVKSMPFSSDRTYRPGFERADCRNVSSRPGTHLTYEGAHRRYSWRVLPHPKGLAGSKVGSGAAARHTLSGPVTG